MHILGLQLASIGALSPLCVNILKRIPNKTIHWPLTPTCSLLIDKKNRDLTWPVSGIFRFLQRVIIAARSNTSPHWPKDKLQYLWCIRFTMKFLLSRISIRDQITLRIIWTLVFCKRCKYVSVKNIILTLIFLHNISTYTIHTYRLVM